MVLKNILYIHEYIYIYYIYSEHILIMKKISTLKLFSLEFEKTLKKRMCKIFENVYV